MKDIDERFYTYSVNEYGHPIAFYPEEMNANLSSLNYDTLDLSEWDPTPKQPLLSTWKWMEPRHQSNFYYSTQGADGPALQTVFFNVWYSMSLQPPHAQHTRTLDRALDIRRLRMALISTPK